MPNKILIVFHSGSNYDYHFIKDLAEEFKKQYTCLGENTQKCITLTVSIEKQVKRIDKSGWEITKNISYIFSLLTAQDLWQALYQILSIIFLKEIIELNVNFDTIIKNMKLVELNISIATVFVNMQTLKMI